MPGRSHNKANQSGRQKAMRVLSPKAYGGAKIIPERRPRRKGVSYSESQLIERAYELKAGFVCDRGLNPKRPVNQDRFLAIAERGLFAVFDGVGGQRAGEVASQTAADTIEEALTHTR